MEPITVINAPLILSAFSRQKIRPPYSPILFGVNAETVIPEKTALKERIIDTFSILEIKNLHFRASKNQLTNIIKKTMNDK
tara:strand:- start:917 stop:1159 length:243 start_codon:yes stop_codon:yes gene_type:complete